MEIGPQFCTQRRGEHEVLVAGGVTWMLREDRLGKREKRDEDVCGERRVVAGVGRHSRIRDIETKVVQKLDSSDRMFFVLRPCRPTSDLLYTCWWI